MAKKVHVSNINWGFAASGSLAGPNSFLGLSPEGKLILASVTGSLTGVVISDGKKVGINESSPDNNLHVTNTSGDARAVIKLEQLDVDEPFILFTGTTASDQTKSLSTDTTVGSLTGHIRVSVNGTDYWIPYYAAN